MAGSPGGAGVYQPLFIQQRSAIVQQVPSTELNNQSERGVCFCPKRVESGHGLNALSDYFLHRLHWDNCIFRDRDLVLRPGAETQMTAAKQILGGVSSQVA